jgi:hypothetical protein
MPTSTSVTAIAVAVWKPDGDTWIRCGCRCWNASAVNTTWWRKPISEVPAVVQFDGIWPEPGKRSKRASTRIVASEKRHRKSGKRIVVLVALGLWTDGSRKRRILDWEVAGQKVEQAAWERLVQRLWERGVKLETGLQAIVRDGSEGLEQALDYVYGSALVQQRCIFHKLRNVSNRCVGLNREGIKLFMEQAPIHLTKGNRRQESSDLAYYQKAKQQGAFDV